MATAEDRTGWYEFIRDGAVTTHVAYVYEDGSVYFPEGPDVVCEIDFRLATAAGRCWRLVREADTEPRQESEHAGD